jgi:hypothetical protein
MYIIFICNSSPGIAAGRAAAGDNMPSLQLPCPLPMAEGRNECMKEGKKQRRNCGVDNGRYE